MKARLLAATVVSTLVLSLLLVASGRTGAHTGDWIDSAWTTSPPTIEGAMTAGEWSDATAIDLSLIPGNQVIAYLIVKNDANFIYIAYDAIGDTTNDPGDVAAIAFDTGHDTSMSAGHEDEFLWGPGSPDGQDHYVSDGTSWYLEDGPFDTGLPNHAGLAGAFGFGPSDLSGAAHEIYELQIPFALLMVSPGDVIGFLGASQPAPGVLDTSAGFSYSTWPVYLLGPPPLDKYGDLRIGKPTQPADLDINPPSQSGQGPPLTTVDYTLTVVNLGSSVDTFEMGVMSAWPATLWDATGTNPLPDSNSNGNPDTGPVAPATSVDIVARVGIDSLGCDNAIVNGVSSNNPMVSDAATLHTCAATTLSPPHSDTAVDTDMPPNGLYNELRIGVGVMVNSPGFYEVDVDLYDQTQTTWIVWSNTFSPLPAGYSMVTVVLSGPSIYSSGIDGPYYADIGLYDDIGNLIDRGGHITAAYLYTDFDGPGASLNPPHSDYGVDTDMPPNGLYNELRIDVGVMASTAGVYEVSVNLWDQTMTMWITSNLVFTFLSSGPSIVSVSLNGVDINLMGIDGPYAADISLYDDVGTLLDFGTYFTAAYLHTDFDGPGAVLNPPHSDTGVDTDAPPNGLYDELRIDVGVMASTAGFYQASIGLYDQTGTFWITSRGNMSFLSSGAGSISVSLLGNNIYNSGIDGPYLADIWLYDDMGNFLDRGSHATAAYLFTDFDGPDALFNPPHSDFGNDTDLPPDGYYDYLQIDVGVTVSQAGTYDVSGPLFDPMMNYITFASASAYLGIGDQSVPLQYVGRDILVSGYDGPYTAFLQLTDLNSTLDSDTYTTAMYTHTQFQPPSAQFEPPHSDYGLDLTVPADGLFEFLVVNASVNALRAGTYQVDVTLWDSSYSFQITTASQAADLVIGVQDVPIRLDGMVIRSSGFNGPYWAELTLSDSVGTLDFDTYQTNPYLWNDFSPPGASFDPPYTDRALDTDTPPSGGYDLLVVDVGVSVTVPGTYIVTGILYYGGWLFIDTATCQLLMNTGRTICPLEFDAHLIADLGLSGTFDVVLSLSDEFGRRLDMDMYTTGPYLSSDFEQSDTGVPIATAGSVPYWKNTAPLNVQFTANDPVPTDGLETVTLYYRFSTDNSTWNAWAPYASQDVAGSSATGSIPFSFPSGAGYYEFQMTATDERGNVEAQGPAESRVAFRPLTELAITPRPLSITAGNQGTLTISVLSSGGVAAYLEAALTITLVPFSPAGEFRLVGTQTAITSVVIPAGQSSVTVDYYDETSGDWDVLGHTATGFGGLGQVTVAPAAASVITITPSSGWVQVGGSVNLTALATDAFGNSVNAASVAWTVSGPGTLSTPSGATTRLTASSSGAIVVTATIGSISITATFTGLQPGGGGTGGGTTGADTTTLAAVGIGAIIGGIVIGMLVGLMIGRKKAKPETPVGTTPPPPPQGMPPQVPPEGSPPPGQPPIQ